VILNAESIEPKVLDNTLTVLLKHEHDLIRARRALVAERRSEPQAPEGRRPPRSPRPPRPPRIDPGGFDPERFDPEGFNPDILGGNGPAEGETNGR